MFFFFFFFLELNTIRQYLRQNYVGISSTFFCLRQSNTVRSNGRHYCLCRCFIDAKEFIRAKRKEKKKMRGGGMQ
jgi:hypothetical protein